MNAGQKPRLLLTGASGFLGYNIYQQAKERFQVLGIVNQHPVSLPGMQLLQLDLTKETGLRNVIRETRPDAIIHTAAISDINYCQNHPEETAKLNVNTAIYLAKLAAELAIPYVFTSTDLVFDGTSGNYTEMDAVSPINHYGEQKVAAEAGIKQAYSEAAICRMPLMYGIAGPGSKNFFLPLLAKIKNREEIALFTDEYRSTLGGISAAKGLLLALSSFHGTYHLGGGQKMSRYDLGLLMAEIAGIENHNIKPGKQADIAMPAPRPKDATFDSSKARSAGFNPYTSREELKMILSAI